MKIETKEDARQVIRECEALLARHPGGSERRRLSMLKQDMVAKLASLPDRQLAKKPIPRPTKKEERPAYVGPRCGYCGGEQPQGERCHNEGPDWPHPPYKTTNDKEVAHA